MCVTISFIFLSLLITYAQDRNWKRVKEPDLPLNFFKCRTNYNYKRGFSRCPWKETIGPPQQFLLVLPLHVLIVSIDMDWKFFAVFRFFFFAFHPNSLEKALWIHFLFTSFLRNLFTYSVYLHIPTYNLTLPLFRFLSFRLSFLITTCFSQPLYFSEQTDCY